MSKNDLETLTVRDVRRLALHAAGFLQPKKLGLPTSGRGQRARNAATAWIEHFGYLQLDTVSIVGARTQGIVLHSRLDGFDPMFAEELLQPGEGLWEYWGHEASWMPLEMYPLFGFRRKRYKIHHWYQDIAEKHPEVQKQILRQIRRDGPAKSVELKGPKQKGWWNESVARRLAAGLWASGKLDILERKHFHRTFDLPERVIPESLRKTRVPTATAMKQLTLMALRGHGWASEKTIVDTWRLNKERSDVRKALARLKDDGKIVDLNFEDRDGRLHRGWIRAEDLEKLPSLRRARPNPERSILLSPFDPLLWDRKRVDQLFGFHQKLEIYTPAPQRKYGYYVLPVLAGEELVSRLDLKADRKAGRLNVLNRVDEESHSLSKAALNHAVSAALTRYAEAARLMVDG